MEFQGSRLVLISGALTYMVLFEQAHLNDPAYYRWVTDIDVVRYIGREELHKKISFPQLTQYVSGLWDNKLTTFLAVYHKHSAKFIGTSKINFVDERGGRQGIADIGIMIGEREFWGKGIGTDILRAVSRFAFDSLNARKLLAGAMSPNVAVIKAFLRIGFQVEGRLRQQFVDANGRKLHDHVLLGCFRDELRDE